MRLLSAALLFGFACSPTTNTAPLGPKDAEPTIEEDGSVSAPDAGHDGGAEPIADSGLPYYTWWQDVQPIVANRCQLCHINPPQFGAPRPFVEYQDTQVLIGTVPAHQVMAYRIVADQNRMPPSTQPQLSDAEIQIIRIWSEIGAPEGIRPIEPTDGGTPPETDAGEVEETDAGTMPRTVSRTLEIRATAANGVDAYELPVENTNYVCWSITVPQGMATDEGAFRFEPILDNTANTHHMLLFHDDDAGNSAGPFGCDGLPTEWDMIGGWAPGRTADEIPEGASVPIAAGDQIVLQVHYDNVLSAGTLDNSGMRIVFTDDPGLIPAGIVWSGVIWGSPLNGPNETRTHTCTINDAVTMFAVFPHMHRTGTRITLEVQRGGSGGWTSLVDIAGWSFEDQPNVPIDPVEQSFTPGDRLRTTCYWDTMGQSIPFGEASSDEMCFNFVYHYPKMASDFCVGLQF